MAKAEHLPPVKAIIYPVPPLKGNFFLGIHTTLNVHGDLKIGPSVFMHLDKDLPCLVEITVFIERKF